MISQEKFLELIDLLLSESWSAFECEAEQARLFDELGEAAQNQLRQKINHNRNLSYEIQDLKAKLSDEQHVNHNRQSQLQTTITEQKEKIDQLQAELTTEKENHQDFVQTSQEWHERQKQEIITQQKQKLTTFLNQRKTILLQEITLIKEALHD